MDSGLARGSGGLGKSGDNCGSKKEGMKGKWW